MTLSIREVKTRLGRGAQSDIARRFGYTRGHVSEVLRGLRADRRIARLVAARLKVRMADLPPEYIAPAPQSTAA